MSKMQKTSKKSKQTHKTRKVRNNAQRRIGKERATTREGTTKSRKSEKAQMVNGMNKKDKELLDHAVNIIISANAGMGATIIMTLLVLSPYFQTWMGYILGIFIFGYAIWGFYEALQFDKGIKS